MARPLPALPGGRLVFVDANIFIYGLLGQSPQCIRPAASVLKSKHDAIRGLRKYLATDCRIFQWNLVVIGSNDARHGGAQRIREEHGLLTNDR